jgi:membrane-bound ClpP family serine protease
MPWIIILILIALGIIFILLELLVVPGTTFIGIIGFVSLVLGVYQTFTIYGTTWGIIALVGTSIFSIAMLVLSLRSKTWTKAMLSTNSDSKVNQESNAFKVGDEGIAVSRLTPMGTARFGNQFIEISTFGDFLDPETRIRIVDIKNNKIFVEVINS